DAFGLSVVEKRSLERLQQLFDTKHFNEVGIELDAFSRTRTFASDFLLYLMGLATRADQNLNAFRIANELIQRRYDNQLSAEMIDMIFPDRYVKEIEATSIKNRLDPLLILSLIKQESGFKATALSHVGAVGLMQLMPFTAVEVDEETPLHELRDP